MFQTFVSYPGRLREPRLFGLCLLVLSAPLVSSGCEPGEAPSNGGQAIALPDVDDLRGEGPLSMPTDWGSGVNELPFPKDSGMTLWHESKEGEKPAVTSGILVDVDRDGRTEAILGSEGCCSESESIQVWSYDPEEAMWEARADLEQELHVDSQSLVGIVDLDGDGHLDALSSDPERLMRWGTGPGSFGESELDVSSETHTTAGFVQSVDLNRDGLLDLVVGHHTCSQGKGTVVPILQQGKRRWQLAPDFFPESLRLGTYYGILQYPSPLSPNMFFLTGRNCNKSDPYDPFLMETGRTKSGAVQWEGVDPIPLESPVKKHVAVSFGPLSKADPMGATVADLNSDGLLDFVTTLDFRILLLEGEEDGEYKDRSLSSGLHVPAAGDSSAGWGVAAADMDLDGRDDLLVVNGPFRIHENPLPAPISLFWNGGDFNFRRVSYYVNLDHQAPWRGLSVGDIDRDGDPDFLVSAVGERPRAFLNGLPTEGRGVVIELRGTLSTAHGAGARITLEGGDGFPPQHKVMGHVTSPNVQGPPALFFALPPERSEGTFTIHWPSGLTSSETVSTRGFHTFVEPDVVQIEPESRILFAEGLSTGRIRIRPSSENSEVALWRMGADGTEKVELHEEEGGGYVHTWTASTTPTQWTFEIHVDGSPLGILPAVFEVALDEDQSRPHQE